MPSRVIKQDQSKRGVRTALLVAVGALAFYTATVGAIPAMGRHMEDGSLQWMRGSSAARMAFGCYEWPARHLVRLPALHAAFEVSAEFWCWLTNAPETTG